MSDDGFDLSRCDPRHLTPRQSMRLRKSIIGRAHEARNLVIRHMVMGAFAAILNAWQQIGCRQQARAALRSMSEYELRDIGISRAGIEAAIRQNDTDTNDHRSDLRHSTSAAHPINPSNVNRRRSCLKPIGSSASRSAISSVIPNI
jgi:uncharacterized protein YjiS (DUF1127 family)